MYCTNIQGSALYDATLGDKDLIDQMYEQAIAEQSAKRKKEPDEAEYHPPRRGYTREVEALHEVVDNLIAMRAENGKWPATSVRFSPRPLFPAEAVHDRMRARARQRRDAAIAKAQNRFRSRRDQPT